MHHLPEREAVGRLVALRHAQVLLLAGSIIVLLQVELRLPPLHPRPRLDGVPHRLRVALAALLEVEGLPDRGVGLTVAHHAAVLSDQRDLARVRPRPRLHGRQALRLQHADGEGVKAKGLNGPVDTDVLWVACRLTLVRRRSRIKGLLCRQTRTHGLAKVGCLEERVVGIDVVEAPLVDHGVDERRRTGGGRHTRGGHREPHGCSANPLAGRFDGAVERVH